MLVLHTYRTRLASNEIFSPRNKIHREGGRAKDLSALLYCYEIKTKYMSRLYLFSSHLLHTPRAEGIKQTRDLTKYAAIFIALYVKYS
jgi:hypothetical protein